MAAAPRFQHTAFEVRGLVQGVFFRKYTKLKAGELASVGWVQNHADGERVVGEAEGAPEAVARFQQWLRATGSPKCRIDTAEFSKNREISALSFKTFEVRR